MSSSFNINHQICVTRYLGPAYLKDRTLYQVDTPAEMIRGLTINELRDLALWILDECKEGHVEDAEVRD